jgi:sulfopyruvate decarboxylase TPP-binding subunit
MDVFRAQKIRQVAYLPDTGLKRLIELVRADKEIKEVPLTTEEEGVALAVGACLGGERAVLLVQSSGTGNCINMLGMITECRVPLLMIVTMRGTWATWRIYFTAARWHGIEVAVSAGAAQNIIYYCLITCVYA